MLTEIRQQPEALERTLRAGIRPIERFRRLLEKRRPRLVLLAARGTSDQAALVDEMAQPKLLAGGLQVRVRLGEPNPFKDFQAPVSPKDEFTRSAVGTLVGTLV